MSSLVSDVVCAVLLCIIYSLSVDLLQLLQVVAVS